MCNLTLKDGSMRVLLVGAGGVGSAATAIAARRDFFEHFVVADYDLDRARRAVAGARRRPVRRGAGGRLGRRRRAGAVPRAPDHARPERGGSAVRHADLRRRVFAPVPTTWTWRCRCRTRIPTEPYAKTGVKLGDEQFAVADKWDRDRAAGAGRHRRRTRTVGRLRPLRRRSPVQLDRRVRRTRRLQPDRRRL